MQFLESVQQERKICNARINSRNRNCARVEMVLCKCELSAISDHWSTIVLILGFSIGICCF